ncbi:MAG TPA: hypothetical protein VNM67_15455 [Thermoanaerobaculia bacterium]|jgi:hypothetical protein|nr:hypothetical protein [Thermoanaerobaculia bacterium]
MPDIGSYAKVVQDWKKVLAATEEHEWKMPDVAQVRQQLQQELTKAEGAKTRQDSHTAWRQLATQELKEVLITGRDLAMRLRFAAKLGLGPRNEQLVQFGVAPLRGRAGKPKVVLPPVPEAPAPEPQSQSSEE